MPDGFRFAVKAPPRALRDVATFEERVRRLGDRLGPCGFVVERRATTACSRSCSARLDLRIALDLRHELGRRRRPAVRVNDWEADAPFRYLRFRSRRTPTTSSPASRREIAPLLAADVDVFAYFRHEDAPTAPGTPRGCSSSSARTTADRSRGRRAQERGVVA